MEMDPRSEWILKAAEKRFDEATLADLANFFLIKRDLVEDYFSDRRPFKFLFIWKGSVNDGFKDVEDLEREKEEVPVLAELSESEDEDGEDADDAHAGSQNEVGERRPPISKSTLFRIEANALSAHLDPLDLAVVAVCRLKNGFVPMAVDATNHEPDTPLCSDFISVETFDDDIFDQVWSLTRPPEGEIHWDFVQKAFDDVDKALLMYNEKAISRELKVDRQQCRFLFRVPFKVAEIELNGEEAFALRQLCQSWLRVLDDFIQKQEEERFEAKDRFGGERHCSRTRLGGRLVTTK